MVGSAGRVYKVLLFNRSITILVLFLRDNKYCPEELIAYKCPMRIITSIVAYRKIEGVCRELTIKRNTFMDEEPGWYLHISGDGREIGPFDSYYNEEFSKVLAKYDIVLPPEDELIENAIRL